MAVHPRRPPRTLAFGQAFHEGVLESKLARERTALASALADSGLIGSLGHRIATLSPWMIQPLRE